MNNIKTKLLTSLDKVFLDEEPSCGFSGEISVFKNEPFSFQTAYSTDTDFDAFYVRMNVSVECENKDDTDCIKMYEVAYVPAEMPAFADSKDTNYLRKTPGLYPDPLMPICSKHELRAMPRVWRSIWFEFTPNENTAAGKHSFTVTFTDLKGEKLSSLTQSVNVIDALLPEQKLIRTEWFHTDCLFTEYNVPAMSDEYWTLVENFAKTAAKRGINMLLTPIFTPPLDTQVGGERPTVQLIGVTYKGGKYSFDFTNLYKWFEMCRRSGIKYLEISHLFTQWGAQFTPKVMAETDEGTKRIFGWDVSATSDEYREFMAALMPELTAILKEHWGKENVYFHVSDEPHIQHLENYKAAKGVIEKYLDGFEIIGALSDYDFYTTGAVKKPIPASDEITPFLENNVEHLWTYYCCSQGEDVANRFMAMPSQRCRVIAPQLFKFKIEGFLQWGFNFWFSQYSKKQINPYYTTDACLGFPSGSLYGLPR